MHAYARHRVKAVDLLNTYQMRQGIAALRFNCGSDASAACSEHCCVYTRCGTCWCHIQCASYDSRMHIAMPRSPPKMVGMKRVGMQ